MNEGVFALAYGGLPWSAQEIEALPFPEFVFYLGRLRTQKEREERELQRLGRSSSSSRR